MCASSGGNSSQDHALLVSKDGIDSETTLQDNVHNSEHSSSAKEATPAPLYPPNRIFCREQLEVLNLLVHPVWIFDLDNRCMRWANDAAVELWNATSLQELLDRNFGDMTEATVTRLTEYRSKFSQGQRICDQWTFYPKGEAKTVHVVGSGVRLSTNEPNPSMLFEGTPAFKEKLQPERLRGTEILRHLPVPVCQFDMSGKIMFQNPEATLQSDDHDSSERGDAKDTTASKEAKNDLCMDSTKPGDFLHRFVDQKVGREVLRRIQEAQKEPGSDEESTINIQTQMKTRAGPRWSAVQLRRTSDPVTGEAVILYSSRDMTDSIQAKKERETSIAKSEFLAIMAHEIRTPLHQVTGFIDLLHDTELNEEQRSFVKVLKSSAQGLMTVINDVLDYSKLEAGKMKLESIPYEPRSVLEGSMEAVRACCEEKNLYLDVDCSKMIPFKVMGDPNRLRQILLNLLSNAVKFTKHGGIQVQVVPEMLLSSSSSPSPETTGSSSSGPRSMMKFIISDTGMGINDEHQVLIFNKYQQGGATVSRHFGGTGLGLFICKMLIHNMGGSIGIDSTLGVGSNFWFLLPIEEPPEETNATDSATDDSLCNHGGGLHILVAEDNQVNQKLLVNMLKRMGHTSEVAVNGKVAIELLERSSNHFDVVLMDIQMPVMDGLEATRRIRSLGYATLPILGLTASVARSDYTKLGFSDWLSKPIPMRELKSKLYRIKRHCP